MAPHEQKKAPQKARSPRRQKAVAPPGGVGESRAPGPRFAFADEHLPAAELTRVLEERARALARLPAAEQQGTGLPVVIFALGEERYAIEARFVEAIHPLQDLTPVPCTPDFCVGVVNLRGRILAVVDLHRFLGLEKVAVAEGAQVIAVNAAGLELGLLANDVREVGSLFLDQLMPALPTAAHVATEYTRGIGPDMLVLLDLEALMRDPRLIVHQEP